MSKAIAWAVGGARSTVELNIGTRSVSLCAAGQGIVEYPIEALDDLIDALEDAVNTVCEMDAEEGR